ncbi:MAG: tRNA (adenosine(37)-N6)-dimethylallyltransferase MiaA [bacterium]|nr:MAG: tRNA (adenosine(37)-N6)-dimethylallyltransferase MiaA [bacterium]
MTARPFLLVLGGPTASGKSALAMHLSSQVPMEIINVDSMQVYRGMDVGTAKAGPAEGRRVRHHLLDLCDPDEPFSVGRYIPLFRGKVEEITTREHLPVAVGGTGLYLRGALRGLFEGPARDEGLRSQLREKEQHHPGILYTLLEERDPETARRTRPSDLVRIIRALEVHTITGMPISGHQARHAFADRPFDARVYCLNPDRQALYLWIEERVDSMMASGFLQEVRRLKEKGYSRDLTAMKGLGYRELMAHLEGETTLEEAVQLIKRNTRRYAKRQITWFRGEEGVMWLDYRSRGEIPEMAQRIVREVRSAGYPVKGSVS